MPSEFIDLSLIGFQNFQDFHSFMYSQNKMNKSRLTAPVSESDCLFFFFFVSLNGMS